MTRLKPATGLWKIQPQWVVTPGKQTTNVFRTKTDKLYGILARNLAGKIAWKNLNIDVTII
jgi:hypothetical protein